MLTMLSVVDFNYLIIYCVRQALFYSSESPRTALVHSAFSCLTLPPDVPFVISSLSYIFL